MENRILTGRDLIVYILENNLEDEPIFNDGSILGCLMTDVKVAALLNTGVATVDTLYEIGKLPGVKIGDTIYIFYKE